ncbi:bifunctional riboflavin kinase/FAD synthetase [Halieaceae bacterium IMCC14734]|uniref:Riboflavin biosynthesis protein n=1 Tax=Candidatus Litorirhabdus singularis TaxID=2518993 RepID=A0ABT3TLN5_9GAMM|nr:bifunctional riboflavin kinase/FAD synthetase [Candidatus Litorirhabdus singularis]MCX2983213.1 bifunctional riboflavin kinase/FAD synthetase [Candidatus Litorirhabdus singularis]
MELIRGLHNLRPHHRGCVATIGAFDGVHHGHRAVLGHLLEKAQELQLPAVVVLFEPLPREYFAPTRAPARLMSFREKFVALKELGIDRVLRIRFDQKLQTMSAQDFISEIFVKGLGVRYIVVGDDLRFGHDREGDYWMMKAQGEQFGYETMHTSTLGFSGTRVSSTRIREALEKSDFALAEELLGRPYAITGKVVYGEQVGRSFGAPTANMELHRLRPPLAGVYAVEVRGALAGAADKLVAGVANVGTRPTVNDSIRANLEVHLLDFDADLYGRTIQVIFRHKLRDEHKFESLDLLKQQIHKDLAQGREFFKL